MNIKMKDRIDSIKIEFLVKIILILIVLGQVFEIKTMKTTTHSRYEQTIFYQIRIVDVPLLNYSRGYDYDY